MRNDHSCPTTFSFSGNLVYKTDCAKYLGLLVDDKLSFKPHVDDLCNDLDKYADILNRLRSAIPHPVLLRIYYSLVYAKIAYGIEIYGMTSTSALRPIQVLQNRVLKIITLKHRRLSTNLLHQRLVILKISDIHIFKMYILFTGTLTIFCLMYS